MTYLGLVASKSYTHMPHSSTVVLMVSVDTLISSMILAVLCYETWLMHKLYMAESRRRLR